MSSYSVSSPEGQVENSVSLNFHDNTVLMEDDPSQESETLIQPDLFNSNMRNPMTTPVVLHFQALHRRRKVRSQQQPCCIESLT